MPTCYNALAERLATEGFRVNPVKQRIYLNGYGRDVAAFLEWPDGDSGAEADPDDLLAGTRVRIKTRAAAHSGIAWDRKRRVMHKIATGFWRAGLVAEAPPRDWHDMIID